jgi:hypothetical protein
MSIIILLLVLPVLMALLGIAALLVMSGGLLVVSILWRGYYLGSAWVRSFLGGSAYHA